MSFLSLFIFKEMLGHTSILLALPPLKSIQRGSDRKKNILISNKELSLAQFCGFFWGLIIQVLLIITWTLLETAELKFLVSSQCEIKEHKLAFGLYHIWKFPMTVNVHTLRSYFILNHPAERLRSLLRVFKGRKKINFK